MLNLFPVVSWRRVTSASAPTGVPSRARWRTLQGKGLASKGVVLAPRNGRALEGRFAVCSVLSLDAALLDRHGRPEEAHLAAQAAVRAEGLLLALLVAQEERGSTTPRDSRSADAAQVELFTRALHRLASPTSRFDGPAGAPESGSGAGGDLELTNLWRTLRQPSLSTGAEQRDPFLAAWTHLIIVTEGARDAWRDVLPVTETAATWESVVEGRAVLALSDGQSRRIPLTSSLLDGFSMGDPLIIQQEITEDGVVERLLPAVDLGSFDQSIAAQDGDTPAHDSLRPPRFTPQGVDQVRALIDDAPRNDESIE